MLEKLFTSTFIHSLFYYYTFTLNRGLEGRRKCEYSTQRAGRACAPSENAARRGRERIFSVDSGVTSPLEMLIFMQH